MLPQPQECSLHSGASHELHKVESDPCYPSFLGVGVLGMKPGYAFLAGKGEEAPISVSVLLYLVSWVPKNNQGCRHTWRWHCSRMGTPPLGAHPKVGDGV